MTWRSSLPILHVAGSLDRRHSRRLAARSRAPSPSIPAIAYCQGTPLRSELEARGISCLDDATAAATTAISSRFGTGAIEGKMQAHIIIVER